jgi:hypothetical protein
MLSPRSPKISKLENAQAMTNTSTSAGGSSSAHQVWSAGVSAMPPPIVTTRTRQYTAV